jgi:hypothetical protein
VKCLMNLIGRSNRANDLANKVTSWHNLKWTRFF